jgi:hypothetical protein
MDGWMDVCVCLFALLVLGPMRLLADLVLGCVQLLACSLPPWTLAPKVFVAGCCCVVF